MKKIPFLFLFLASSTSIFAQEKVSRKSMIFQPGAKVPDGYPAGKVSGESVQPVASAPAASPGKSEPVKSEKSVEKAPEKAAIKGGKSGSEEALQLGESTDIPNQMAGRFFGLLLKGQVEAAYDGLTKGSKIAERAEESKALRLKTQEALKVFGAVVGFEQVESKSVGPHLLRLTYLTVGKEFPLRWRLYFYRPDSFWRLVDIRVDDRLSGLFGEPEETRNPEGRP